MGAGRIVVFAGTTEGRMITEALGNAGVNVLACVATEFGKQLIEESDHVKVSSERLGEDGMRRITKDCDMVIDATHPYAVVISKKISNACKEANVEYIRLLRSESRVDEEIIIVENVEAAVRFLKTTEGNILVTTGSKELAKYTEIENFKERVFARVLSVPTASQSCAEIGFEGKNLFCMQGPFNEDLNYGMLKQIGAKYLVTKDSGEPGGFEEKMRAAKRAGVKVVVISRPEEIGGFSYSELSEMLSKRLGIPINNDRSKKKRKLTIVGIGMGDQDTLTIGAKKSIESSDLLVGADRMIDSMSSGQDTLREFRADEIISFVDEHHEYRNVVVLVSGDVGFHSAAKKLIERVDQEVFDLEVECGISSISYFCSLVRTSWDDALLMSAHGQNANVVDAARRNKKVIVLLDGSNGVKKLCKELTEFGLDHVKVTVGQDLRQRNEKVTTGSPSYVERAELGTLCIAMIENNDPERRNPLGMKDEMFIRGDAPMTKEEIRSLSIVKLKLADNSILYDVGAGTGSVAVESALCIPDGKVFAIEKEKDALQLIDQNKKRFGAYNLEIVEGYAPEALSDLPPPTHVFIGGSSGELKEIMRTCLRKNPTVRFVINTITLETMSEMIDCMNELDVKEDEIISVNVSRSKKAGRYHLMSAMNPIHIGVCEGNSQ